jgi:predicted dinucleotide-binding enzyme
MTTQTVGIIGAGNIGGGIARLAAGAGIKVVISNSRAPETLAPLVAELGDRVRAATPDEAANNSDIVVTSIPLHAYKSLPAGALAGKTVIDTMVYYPERDGHIAELDDGTLTSSALVQLYLADSPVVKAFSNIDYRRLVTLARPPGSPERSALPVSGDDPAAKARVGWFLDALGYDAVDIGTLAESWRGAPGTALHVRPYLPTPPEGLGQEDMYRWFLDVPGNQVQANRIRELAFAATRVPAGEARASL